MLHVMRARGLSCLKTPCTSIYAAPIPPRWGLFALITMHEVSWLENMNQETTILTFSGKLLRIIDQPDAPFSVRD